jgi:hypothetical protein
MQTRDVWVKAAERELIGLRNADGSWGYRRGAPGCTEPTALAALALGTTGAEAGAARVTAGWLATLQRPDGSLGLSVSQPTPGWMTPYALLLWEATGTHSEQARRAADSLLRLRGAVIPKRDDPNHVVGHDTTIVGWPWVSGTHSWLEPTALAVLALGRAGRGDHPRVREGMRLIRDRAVAGGGWNYGNTAVFGRALRPQPAPTGLALLALAGTEVPAGTIDAAIAYLLRALPELRAPASLGWGLIGLAAWGVVPDQSSGWLEESFQAVSGRVDAASKLEPLLLAAAPETPRLFGREPSTSTHNAAAAHFEERDHEAFERGNVDVELG